MKPVRSSVVSIVFVLIALAAAIWLYPQLPAQTPVHWDLHGRVNGTLPPLWAAAVPVLIVLWLAVLMIVLPKISPRRFGIAPFIRVWSIVMLALQGLMLVLGLCVLLAGAGYHLRIPVIGMAVVGAVFMVLGNYMGKLRQNFFAGIRTPWTLASDAVWERTHRLAGWVFMLAGMVMEVAALTGATSGWLLAVIVAVLLIPAVYSYFAYQRLQGRR
jgi:uncharacterized membrane protein